MLIEQTLDKLHELKLTGMAHALGEQLQNPDAIHTVINYCA